MTTIRYFREISKQRLYPITNYRVIITDYPDAFKRTFNISNVEYQICMNNEEIDFTALSVDVLYY